MQQGDIDYLESVRDHEQYPAARCEMNRHVKMYQRSSSQMAESMNRANTRMRVRSSVDLVNATLLLLQMESERFEKQKEYAISCESLLTPRGCNLRTEVLTKVKESDENFRVRVTRMEAEDPIYYECIVRGGKGGANRIEVADEPDYGFYEVTCDCGVVETQCVPCVHVMAVVKSKLVPHLTPTNVMPNCWSTEIWRKQFPHDEKICSKVDMEYLKMKYQPNDKLRYMPDFVGKRKRGRPKKNARMKSALEIAMRKKKKKKGKGKKKRQLADDILGPDDLEFGFTPDGKPLVDGEEAWI